jgi:type VI secretion system protein
LQVHIAKDANKNNPVAFDLVLVTDKKLLKELMKMSASEWFEKRDQVQLDYPKETELSTRRWEWVPGQLVKLDPIPVKLEIVGGIIFANYFTPGAHRAQIDPRKGLEVNFGVEDFIVRPLKK